MLRSGQSHKERLCCMLVSALGVTALTVAVQQVGILQAIEQAVFDQFFRIRATLPMSTASAVAPPVTLVAVTEADLQALGQWPLSDATLSQLLDTLHRAKPAAIGLNLHRNLPVSPGQDALYQSFVSMPNLIGIQKAVEDTHNGSIAAPAILASRGQTALSDLVLDPDGKLRRHLLSVQTDDGEVVLSLGARLALEYLAQRGIRQHYSNGEKSQIRLGQAVFSPLLPSAGGYVRADMGGYQILSNTYPSPQVFERFSLTEALAGRIPDAQVRDRIVLVGVTAPSLQNSFFVAATTSPKDAWYGVELQADLASQVVAAALGERSLLKGVAAPLGWLWILGWSGISALAGAYLSSQRGLLLALFLGILVLLGSGYGLFVSGWWIVVAAPALSLLKAGLLSRQLVLGQLTTRSQHQLMEYERSLEAKVAATTQQLQEKNDLLTQARAAADQASQAKSQFLARVSHELRTPLSSLLGFSRMMLSDPSLPETSKENIDIINSSGEHLLALVDEVLDIAKIEANQITLKKQVVHLKSLMGDLERLFQLQATEKSLILSCRTDARLPDRIWADETKLRQVLINLLGNALKFTQVGHVILRAWCTTAEPDKICFEVEDTGPGISATELEKIFEPYAQGMAAREMAAPSVAGTGLGLTISRDLARLMGGEISAHSQLGRGSKFRLVLPLRAAEPQLPAGSQGATAYSLPEDLRGKRVLVVDDVMFNRKLLAKLLLDQGIDVKEAEDGTQAIALWQRWQPDLLMLDLLMPYLDGYEVTRRIRQQEAATPGRSPTPIIVTSAGLSPTEQAIAFQAGCNGVIHKPFQRSQVLSAITEALIA